jgi:Flp pilus assembly protein TadG
MTRKTGFAQLLQRFARRDDGAVAIIVALVLPVTLGMVALVEASRVYTVKNQLQITADAAAMASVKQVPSATAVTSTAMDFAHRNMPADGQFGDVLLEQDAVMGHWDVGTRVFTAGGGPANAVRVVTRGEMPLFFAAALRSTHAAFSDTPMSYSPAAQAIALIRLDKCYRNGFVAGGIVEMNSSNSFDSGFCVYGRQGVTVNSANTFAPGTEVGMVDLATLDATLDHNPGLEEALVEKDISAPIAGEATQLLDDLLAGTGPMPAYITSTVTVSELPASPQAGTLYHVTGPVDLKLSGGLLQSIGIISDQSIRIRSNSDLRNVLLGSRGSVDIDSNVEIGDVDFCQTGDGSSLIVSAGGVTGEQVETGSNIALHGVQMVSDGDIVMNSNLTITAASMQSTGDISFNSSFDVAGCPEGTSANVTGNGTKVAQLVD